MNAALCSQHRPCAVGTSEEPEAAHKAAPLWWHQRGPSPEQAGSEEARTDKAKLKQCDTGLTQSVSVQK